MSCTVLTSQLWAIYFGEWAGEGVPQRARTFNYCSMGLLVVAVVIITIAAVAIE
jgi:hypothetical protein